MLKIGEQDAVNILRFFDDLPDPRSKVNRLHRLSDALRARRRGGLAHPGREDGPGAGRAAGRGDAAGTPQRAAARRAGVDRTGRAGTDREVPPQSARSAPAVERLDYHQHHLGQVVPRGLTRGGAGRVLLLLPGLSHQHAGHLQAHPLRPGSGGEEVPRREAPPPASSLADHGRAAAGRRGAASFPVGAA